MTALAGTALLAHGDSPTRGHYAPQVQGAVEYLLACSTPSGLLTGPGEESGRPMHGHGFALMFLASVYGMETNPARRTQAKEVIERRGGVDGSRAKPGRRLDLHPWQRRRRLGHGHAGAGVCAAHNAGFLGAQGDDRRGRALYRALQHARRGHLSIRSARGAGRVWRFRRPRSPRLYNAGEYDAPIAERCLDYVWQQFRGQQKLEQRRRARLSTPTSTPRRPTTWPATNTGTSISPQVRDQLLSMQDKSDGSWNGDGIGKTYGTAIALIILQLPYKYLPVYQR